MSTWQPMETAPKDGTIILLRTKQGVISAAFFPGEWTDHYENGREYSGPVWSCYDDAITLEVEETTEGDFSEALNWMPKPEDPQ